MKVQIKQLEPNPYRDMDHYPISEEKVQRLAESIHQTGFWDNILARKADGKIQIAYGHHRLMALRKVMKPTDEVDIPVKSLDDAVMIKVMANENMEDWKTSPGVIDETVRVAKRFLEEHPEEIHLAFHGRSDQGIGAKVISGFLGWDYTKVQHSLERLGLIDEGIVDQEAVRSLPTERSARDFVKAVKTYKPTAPQQKKAAERIAGMAKGERGEREVLGVIMEEKYPAKKKARERDPRLYDFQLVIKDAADLASKLSSQILTINIYKKEFTDPVYRRETFDLYQALRVLEAELKKLTREGEKNNVKQLKG